MLSKHSGLIADINGGTLTIRADRRCTVSSTTDTADESSKVNTQLKCLFCFPAAIQPKQLLLANEHFMLLALRGQVREGFVGIFTHTCGEMPRLRCMDEVPQRQLGHLKDMWSRIERFYRGVYRSPAIFYEHGRGGGDRSHFEDENYWFHPHLCALPFDGRIHQRLAAEYDAFVNFEIGEIRRRLGRAPYLYVHTPEGSDERRPVVYLTGRRSSLPIEHLRFKKLLQEHAGWTNSWNWRDEDESSELDALIDKFNRWYVAECEQR